MRYKNKIPILIPYKNVEKETHGAFLLGNIFQWLEKNLFWFNQGFSLKCVAVLYEGWTLHHCGTYWLNLTTPWFEMVLCFQTRNTKTWGFSPQCLPTTVFFFPLSQRVSPDHNDLRWHYAKSFPNVSEVTWQYITQWSRCYHHCDLMKPKKNALAFIL